MKQFRSFFLPTLIFIFSTLAATAYAVEKLSWEDCVEKTAKNNASIRSAHENVESSDSKANAAYSGFLPQLSAGFNATRGNSYSFSQLGGVPLNLPSGDNTVSSASISLTQNIFSGFSDDSLVKQGIANKKLARASLDSAKVQASFDLKTAFAGFLYAQKYLELSEQIIKRRAENSEIVELHFESGVENKGSAMLSKAFLSQAKYDKIVARDSIDVSREQLARVMGIDDSKEFVITGGIPLSEPGAEPDVKKVVLETPKHRQSAAQEEASEIGVPLARSNFFPNLNVVGTASAQGNNSWPNTSKRSLMLNLTLPLFNGGKDYFSTKSAIAQYAASTYDRMNVDQQLVPQLKQAFKTYTESIEKLKVDKAFLEAATVRAEIARSKYNNGLLSFEDWDIIENDLITKQKTYIQSERDRINAEAAWELAQGKGVLP